MSHLARRALQSGFRRFASTSRRTQTSRKPGLAALGVTGVAVGAYGLGTFYPPDLVTLLYPRPAAIPLPRDSAEGIRQTAVLEQEMLNHPFLQRSRAEDVNNEWYETRPFSTIDPNSPQMQNHLTFGALRAPSRLAVAPIVRARRDETEAWAFVHVGRGLCGHDGIVHGGLLATLMDEASARTALLNLAPTHVGVTARLEMNYLAPVRAGRFVVLKTKLVERKGRKVIVEGTVEDPDEGTVYVKSRAIFVEPKYSALLGSGEILKALGVPPPEPQPAESKKD